MSSITCKKITRFGKIHYIIGQHLDYYYTINIKKNITNYIYLSFHINDKLNSKPKNVTDIELKFIIKKIKYLFDNYKTVSDRNTIIGFNCYQIMVLFLKKYELISKIKNL